MANSQVQGGIFNNKATRLARIEEPGLHMLDVANLGDVDAVMALLQNSTSNVLLDASGIDSKVVAESGRNGGSLANTPVVPGSVEVQATGINSLKDKNLDGVLYWDRTPGAALISGEDGATSGATLTSAGSDFVAAGVVAGDTVAIKRGDDAGKYTVASLTTTTLVMTEAFPTGGGSSLHFTVNAEDLVAGAVNYFTGLLTLYYPTSPAAASPANKGTVLGTGSFPVDLEPNDTIDVDIDGGGAATATFAAAAAKATASGGTFAAMASETMEVRFRTGGTWGEWQTITFGTEASIQAAVDLINSQLERGYAVAQGAQDVDLYSDAKGTGAGVQTQNVAAGVTTKLGIQDAVDQAGTGDVSNINAVTFTEFKTVVEADVSDSLVELDGGSPRITSDSSNEDANSTIQISAGTITTALGFDTSAHTGADADAKQPITVDYQTSSLIPARQVAQRRVTGRTQDTVEVWMAGNGNGKVRVDVRQDRGPR